MRLSPITPESGYMPKPVRKAIENESTYIFTSCQGFRDHHQIRTDTLSVMCEVCTSSSKAALYLISNEKDVVFPTQLLDFLKVARRWHDYATPVSHTSTQLDLEFSPRRALDWLHHQGSNPIAIRLKGFSNVVNVTKVYFSSSGRYRTDFGHKWPVY